MNASERVEFIKRISERLANDSWTDIDLTLRQFGFPTTFEWEREDRYTYCVYQVEQGDDSAILDLNSYLFSLESVEDPFQGENLLWVANRFRLFLSHVSNEKQFLSELKIQLTAFAIDGFVAHEDIEPTKEWVEQIEIALSTCDACSAVLTAGFHKSKWADHEVGFCLSRRILIVPVRLGTDPYGFISRYQALSPQTKDPKLIAGLLFEIFIKHDLTADRMARALVSQFTDSDSYAEAKTNEELLYKIETWTPDMLREVELAVNNNRQIRESFGVPESIHTLVSRNRT